jgi:hypothetical protein
MSVPLPLSDIVNISVTVAPTAATANSFNQGLFVGPSAVIPSYGANSRLRKYATTAAMLSDGFTAVQPEYIAANIYLAQTPAPGYIWIGRQDLTAIATAIPHAGSAGTNYKVGDIVGVTQGGASNGFLTVLTINVGTGAVLTLGVVAGTQGTAYTVATALATTGGSGTGLTVDITAVGETLLQASQACRAASSLWYGLAVNNPADADNLALAAWADPNWQTTRYYAWSSSVGIPNGTAANIALQLQTLQYRVLGVYSTTQSGLYPNNVYAAAALMGMEMGLNTGLPGSFFTVAHKDLVGIAAEPLTETQATNIKAANFNFYGNYNPYQLFEPGFMSSGVPSFLWLYLAMYVAQLQIAELNVLASLPAVPQTNGGQHLFIQAANAVGATFAGIGFLSGANWAGPAVNVPGISLTSGQAIPLGYLNQSQPYSQQSSGARAAGQAMPIISAITTAGAVVSLLIGVYVQL